MDYLRSVTDPGDMRIITPSLKAYDQLLRDVHPDFIGTRLHGGIRALQHSCRALIIGIDNRATELAKDINLPVVAMDDPENLSMALKNGWEISVTLPEKNIATWKSQFQQNSF